MHQPKPSRLNLQPSRTAIARNSTSEPLGRHLGVVEKRHVLAQRKAHRKLRRCNNEQRFKASFSVKPTAQMAKPATAPAPSATQQRQKFTL